MLKLKHDRTSVHGCYYHLVFVTKYRRKVITAPIEQRFKELLRLIETQHQIVVVRCEAGNQNHIHMFVQLKPKSSVATVVKAIKGYSAKILLQEFPRLRQQVSVKHLWSPSYFVQTVGSVSAEATERYIEAQDKS